MAKHTLKILRREHHKIFKVCFGHFATLCMKGLMGNNQLKCGILYKKIAMQEGDDERTINYEWSFIV